MGSDESRFNVSVTMYEGKSHEAVTMYEGKSHEAVSSNHNIWREKKAEAESNWGPLEYQQRLTARPKRLTLLAQRVIRRRGHCAKRPRTPDAQAAHAPAMDDKRSCSYFAWPAVNYI